LTQHTSIHQFFAKLHHKIRVNLRSGNKCGAQVVLIERINPILQRQGIGA